MCETKLNNLPYTLLTEKILRDSMPSIKDINVTKYLPYLQKYLPKYGITTPLRISHYLAQTGHESQNYDKYRENMNYSAKRLIEIFKYDFDINHDRWLSPQEKQKVLEIAGNPQKIANLVYANQNGNGNEASGDGWKYIARGAIGVTGKENYKECSIFIFGDLRLLENPELLELPEYGILASLWFWTKKKLNSFADLDNLVRITEKINGGTNGLLDRKNRLILAKQAFKI